MIYKYKNLTVNVTTMNPNWVENTGETVMTLPCAFIIELIEYSCNFAEFFLHYEEDFDNIDEAITFFKNLNEDVEVRNPDAIISVYEYCLDNEDREFNFDVETENISWVIHDILHAIHDAGGCTIYVASEIEKERILKSLEITKEQFPNELPDYEFLENLETSFYDRFKEHIYI